jgi:hypothetical protein
MPPEASNGDMQTRKEIGNRFDELEIKCYQDVMALVEDGVGVIDSIVHFCSVNEIEIEMVAPYCLKNLNLRSQIEKNGEGLHFLRPVRRLPI